MTDYLAAFRADPDKDVKHHGVKGQRWGVRRSSSALAAAARMRPGASAKKDSTEKKPAASSSGTVKEKPKGNIQDHVESSTDRYDRLTGAAKAGRAHEFTEADLKFYNARTDALAKINKMNEQQPSWLKDTATKVIQQSAQRQMQGLADAVADKYIGDPLKNALKGAADTAAVAKIAASESKAPKSTPSLKDAAAKIADKVEAATKKDDAPTSTPTPAKTDPSTMRFDDAVKFYKDNPDAAIVPLSGYSPNANKALSDAVNSSRSPKAEAPKTETKTDPSTLRVADAVQYYKDHPDETPVPLKGYSPNAQKAFEDEVKKARGK